MPLFNQSVLSVCVSVSVYGVTLVVFTDCESSTRPISANPGSIEACEYGLTRGTCFVARRLEMVAVAGLLWIFVVCFGCGGISFFERTLPAASMRPPCLIYLSTSTGVRTGCHYFITSTSAPNERVYVTYHAACNVEFQPPIGRTRS